MKKDIYKEIGKKRWLFDVTRKFNWFVQNTQIQANSSQALKKYLGFDSSLKNYLILNGDEYYTEEDSDRYNLLLDNFFSKDNQFFEKFSKRVFKIADKVYSYRDRLRSINFGKYSHRDLADEIEKFQEVYKLSFAPAFSRPDTYLEKKLKAKLKKELGVNDKRVEELFSKIAAYSPLGELAYTEEPLDLLKIAKEIKENSFDLTNLPKRIKEELEEHVSKYAWMKGPELTEVVAFTEVEYLDRLKNLLTKNIGSEIKRILTLRKDILKEYGGVLKKISKYPRIRALAEAVRNFMFLRTYTTEASISLFYVGRHALLKEAAARVNLSPEQIVMLTSKEIESLLLGAKLNVAKLINQRLSGYAIIWIEGEVSTFFGKEAIKLQKWAASKYKGITKFRETNIIKGTPASLGKVKGQVKVLSSHLEVGKVNSGDILVTSMTTPDYIIAMEKAAAFVTDEGGITCHAAIVAREFGVPCVVGTGNATSLLKDGDLVEVDANEGRVRILKS